MSYHVQYGSTVIKSKSCVPIKKYKLRYLSLAVVLILGLLFLGGDDGILFKALFPGDSAVTFSALQELTENIKAGDSFSDSLAAFCKDIIENAQISSS